MKIGILTKDFISDLNASTNGVANTYLNIIKKEHYPFMIDSNLDLNKNKDILLKEFKDVSGFILPGGDKITDIDLFIIDYCYKNDIPLLGICLGMQEISFYFDNQTLSKLDNLSHFDMSKDYLHDIEINKKGYLYQLLKKEKINVNSRHKFHIKENNNYAIEAYKDNVIEAIKVKNKKYILGVQFHPEIMYTYDENAKLIFDDFFTHCKNL